MGFAEVRFYFGALVKGERLTLALVSLYSPPDTTLLTASYDTLWSCQYHGSDALGVVNVKQIVSVVAMVPLPRKVEDGDSEEDDEESYFVVEKPGLEVFFLGDVEEDLSDDDADDE